MYLVLFYQVFNKNNSVVISEPMDFGSEDNFKKFCERTKAVPINEDRDLYRYKPPNENEPALYMKVVKINQFVSDDDLIAALEFKW
jgi:hypothetical protein